MLIGLDTEYVHRPEAADNAILSYQMSCILQDDGGARFAETIVYPSGENFDDRKTLADLMLAAFRLFGIGRRKAANMRVLLLSHFGVAEWSAMKNRQELAAYLTPVRNVPVSFRQIPVRLAWGSDNYTDFGVVMRDTILLAPNGKKSLKDLSSVTQNKKMDLTKDEIGDMRQLLATNPDRFIAYAINDCRVALEYYLMFMAEYENIFGFSAQPLTLGDAAVKAYLEWLDKHPDLSKAKVFGFEAVDVVDEDGRERRTKRKTDSRRFTEIIAASSYMGGMNIAYELGEHYNPEQIILDIDFAGAYPAALAALPIIDWSQHSTPIQHTGLLAAHHVASAGFTLPAGAVGVSFVHCRFAFPADCEHPCLPVASKYGLLYPLEGVTTCTGIEVAAALQMGAKVEVLRSEWFPPLVDDMYMPRLAFAEFLADVTQRRAREPKGSLKNLMLKEIANSFYGKLAQGIEDRNVYNLSGKSEKLKSSAITTPHYASMCTGSVRAALSVVVSEVSKHPGCEVLSATTDGCMIAVPRAFSVWSDGRGMAECDPFDVVCPSIYAALKRYFPVMALEQGRLNMGLPAESWLEIKHVGDRAFTYKTRGYELSYHGVTQHLARAGHQVSSADELLALHQDEGIPLTEIKSLASIRSIAEGKSRDLVGEVLQRKANTDFDFKRIPLLDGSGRTRPPRTVEEVFASRRAATSLRARGNRATPESVQMNMAGVSLRGGQHAAIRRQVLRAVAQNAGGWRPVGMRDAEIANALGVPKQAIKDAKRRRFLPQSLPDCREVRDVVRGEAAKLRRKVTDGMWSVLLSR